MNWNPTSTGLSHQTSLAPISKMKEAAAANGWPVKVEVGLIGSCTNSSYEDISRAVSLCKTGTGKRIKDKKQNSPSHRAPNRCAIPSNAMASSIHSTRSVQRFLPTPAGPVSGCGTGLVLTKQRKIPSCIHSTATSQTCRRQPEHLCVRGFS